MHEDFEKVRAGLIARDPAIVDVLREFSSASISSSEAAERLGLEFVSNVFDLLGMTNLPFPSLPDERLDEMVRELDDFLGQPKG